MNDRDQRRQDRALRVLTFGTDNAADFAPTGKAAGHFAELGTLVTQLNEARADQVPARVSTHTLLDALNEDFANISRTAQAIALNVPGFSAGFLVPESPAQAVRLSHGDALLARLEDQATDDAATKTAKAALRARFVDYELPADFVADLRADLDALRAAGGLNRGETQEGVESTAAISVLLDKAATVVQHLDAIMKNKYARHPEKLRTWHSASRVERAPRRSRAEDDASATPTTPTTPPTTTK